MRKKEEELLNHPEQVQTGSPSHFRVQDLNLLKTA